jgi:RNA methyltransferase, TrmH family
MSWKGPRSSVSFSPPGLRSPNFSYVRTGRDPVTIRASASCPRPRCNASATSPIERTSLATGELNRGLTLALDGVQDAGNVGTLLRVADWFGLDRVLLSPDCADLFSQKVINASMGSFSRVRTITLPLEAALRDLAVPVLGCDLGGDDVHGLPVLHDAVIVIGSEGRGLTEAVRTRVTRLVTIPRIGGAESLNAGVAAAIVCDNLRRLQVK